LAGASAHAEARSRLPDTKTTIAPYVLDCNGGKLLLRPG
jgi:hypothetical protein